LLDDQLAGDLGKLRFASCEGDVNQQKLISS